MNPLTLSGLYIYPIKSAGGVSLTTGQLDDRGLQHDRRWMLVDNQNSFLTQRKFPGMALISVELAPESLVVRGPAMKDLEVPFRLKNPETLRVRVWDDVVEAHSAGDDASSWFSQFLGFPCKLVSMPEGAIRLVNPKYGQSQMSFADSFPLLLISEASLNDLNSRLDTPVPMNRFRPNLVVRGCSPYEEDEWQGICIGAIAIQIGKPCSRCTVPTVDQSTGIQGKEPIRTLSTYRSRDGKVYFGQNVIHLSKGTLTVGDHIEIISRR